ncbi:17301_t:CDS:2, partial [Racocetra fulgida]
LKAVAEVMAEAATEVVEAMAEAATAETLEAAIAEASEAVTAEASKAAIVEVLEVATAEASEAATAETSEAAMSEAATSEATKAATAEAAIAEATAEPTAKEDNVKNMVSTIDNNESSKLEKNKVEDLTVTNDTTIKNSLDNSAEKDEEKIFIHYQEFAKMDNADGMKVIDYSCYNRVEVETNEYKISINVDIVEIICIEQVDSRINVKEMDKVSVMNYEDTNQVKGIKVNIPDSNNGINDLKCCYEIESGIENDDDEICITGGSHQNRIRVKIGEYEAFKYDMKCDDDDQNVIDQGDGIYYYRKCCNNGVGVDKDDGMAFE